MSQEILTSPEVATLLGRSPRTVHRLVKSGQLVPVKQFAGPNGAFLFDRETVEAFVSQRSEQVPA